MMTINDPTRFDPVLVDLVKKAFTVDDDVAGATLGMVGHREGLLGERCYKLQVHNVARIDVNTSGKALSYLQSLHNLQDGFTTGEGAEAVETEGLHVPHFASFLNDDEWAPETRVHEFRDLVEMCKPA